MRIYRLLLRNWRGVEEREVQFASSGVTIVEGPNESGKSSLVEALDALFDYYDDTKKREILLVKPVHKDAGAEVEADIETGPYRFIYSKRFHKRPETRLVVSAPAPENLTGREAHDRVRRILEETMDLALWSALRIEQGQEIAQANLTEQRSLSAALTMAAGGAQAGDTETSLFDAAREEFLRWFTPTGSDRQETVDAEGLVSDLESTLAMTRSDLARLDADVERSAQLDRAVLDAQRTVNESATTETHHEKRLLGIERRTSRVRETKVALDAAAAASRVAEQAATERGALVEETHAAEAELTRSVLGDELGDPAVEDARRELEAALAAFTAASAAADKAEHASAARQRDFDFHKESLDLQLLRERRDRIVAADEAAAQAEAVLATNAVTDDALKRVRTAQTAIERARGALAAGSPILRLRALDDLPARVDGVLRPLSKGEDAVLSVSGTLRVELPGVADIEVCTGDGTSDLRDAMEKAARKLGEECRAAGVANLDEAVRANAAWQSAGRDVAARDRVVTENLRDLDRDTIARKIAGLEPRVAVYLASRTAAFPPSPDLDAAQAAVRAGQKEVDAARESRRTTEVLREKARLRSEKLRDEQAKTQEARVRAKTRQELGAARLAAARARATDDDLARAAAEARAALEAAEVVHGTEARTLELEQPHAVRLLAENARSARRSAAERLRAVEDERIDVRSRLRERGEEGLSERADADATRLERARDELARRNVHAAAARLLFETLEDERARARRAYVAPLRDRIEQLGRVLHGPTFSVELDDKTLQVARRTVEGRTVPFESLSGGAKEQIGIVARLACAMTVASDGGVPVVFDDTLGHTDPNRIEAMGALLGMAGRMCQVIVLTCVPERFRHVGGAVIVALQ